MNYIIHINSLEICREFHRLSRPIPLPIGEETDSMFVFIVHPTDGRTAFGFDIENVLVNHDWDGVDAQSLTDAIGLNQGQANGFNGMVQSTIITPQGAEPISGYVLGRFPSSAIMNIVSTDIKSQTFMINDGWFPDL